MTRYHEVVVVGAGIAGGLVAYGLARAGLDVAIVERHSLPRYKPCGGGLTPKALRLLPIDIKGLIEDPCNRARVELRGVPFISKETEIPMVYTVMRDVLDHFIVDAALGAGASLYHQAFIDLEKRHGDVAVRTSGEDLTCRFLVGADGALSRVRRSLGLRRHCVWMWGLQSELYPLRGRQMERFKGTVRFDIGFEKSGYSWAFPKKDHVSLGTATVMGETSALKRHLYGYMKSIDLADWEMRVLRIHPIPFDGGFQEMSEVHDAILVGDAAAITDPISGEGMLYAIKSALLACDSIKSNYERQENAIQAYFQELRKQIFQELIHAYNLAKFFYSRPWLFRSAVILLGRLFVARYYEVVTGISDYSQIMSSFLLNMLRGRLSHERRSKS